MRQIILCCRLVVLILPNRSGGWNNWGVWNENVKKLILEYLRVKKRQISKS